ncbi:STAS/SEC14 domain-containing protein [Gymnodinialimonas phycosphaerae]|uniref:STAS/SEC14 domain-containing protein n=1 Tax=Gymnodinialimonas phycosphaerae TaxID=2841589 RepID=UPI0031F3C97A
MLLDMTPFTGSDWDAMFDSDDIASRFRALSEVRHYAVIGAPDRAAKMIGWMDKVIAVKAKEFDTSERAKAWAFIGASEADTASRIRSA